MKRSPMNKCGMEVLAPAGSAEALRAAVKAGADAVYLAGKAFGARAAAANFTKDELRDAVVYCAQRNVKVYVTVNTLIKDTELNEAMRFIAFLCEIGVDAVIVQDLGLLRCIHRQAPSMVVHASTQMTLSGSRGIALVEPYGVERAILPRELSLDEIASIRGKTKVSLEVFVHGALCMSVSGQCYYSSTLGGRSGNRGRCAQPCRLPFAKGYPLSLKDLSAVTELQRLCAAGVCCGKIEGRMKRPEYVLASVGACRQMLDEGAVQPHQLVSLQSVFSRSGFTNGYMQGQRGHAMFGHRTKEAAKEEKQALAAIRAQYRLEKKRIALKIEAEIDQGSVRLRITAPDGMCAQQELPAEAVGLDKERCRKQLAKTGDGPYYAEEISVPEAGLPMTIARLNQLRRETIDVLTQKRSYRKRIAFTAEAPGKNSGGDQSRISELHGVFRTVSQIPDDCDMLDNLYIPLAHEIERHPLQIEKQPDKLVFVLPRILFGEQHAAQTLSAIQEKQRLGYNRFACGTLDAVALCREAKAEIAGLHTLNLFNHESLRFLLENGVHMSELSCELSSRALEEMEHVAGFKKGLMLYGRIPLMLARNCPVKMQPDTCARCKGDGALIDRRGMQLPVRCSGHGEMFYTEIYNNVPVYIPKEKVRGVNYGVLHFTTESAEDVKKILSIYGDGNSKATDDEGFTRRSFTHGVE